MPLPGRRPGTERPDVDPSGSALRADHGIHGGPRLNAVARSATWHRTAGCRPGVSSPSWPRHSWRATA